MPRLSAVLSFWRAHREGRPSWLIWLPIVVMNVFVATLIPLGRYSVPILPCLMILAAFGVDTLLSRRGMVTADETHGGSFAGVIPAHEPIDQARLDH